MHTEWRDCVAWESFTMGLEDAVYPLLSIYDRLPHRLKSGIGGRTGTSRSV